MEEDKKYNEELEDYLGEGIDYQANTISRADQGDLEQLAADSFWTGWQKAKEHFTEK